MLIITSKKHFKGKILYREKCTYLCISALYQTYQCLVLEQKTYVVKEEFCNVKMNMDLKSKFSDPKRC